MGGISYNQGKTLLCKLTGVNFLNKNRNKTFIKYDKLQIYHNKYGFIP